MFMSSIKNKTCLFLATETEPASGGVGYYNDSFIKGLSDHFYDRVIVYGAHDKNLRVDSLTLPLINNILPKKIINAFVLVFKLAFKKVDAIICAHVFLLPLALIFSFLRRKKITLIVYGIDCWGGRLKKYASFYDRIESIVSISEFTSKQLIDQGYPEQRIIKIPPLVDFSNAPKSVQRNQKDMIEVLTVGRMSTLEKYKGHREVLKAIAELSRRQIKVHYHVAGSGDDLPALKELASKMKIEDVVTFHGFVSNEKLEELYHQCDIFVMPSQVSTLSHDLKGEGFGIVFVEAAKYRMAVIGPNSGGSDDIIFSEQTGIAINPESSIEIADAIQKLASDHSLREDLGKNLYEHCEKLFALDKRQDYLKNLFEVSSNV